MSRIRMSSLPTAQPNEESHLTKSHVEESEVQESLVATATRLTVADQLEAVCGTYQSLQVKLERFATTLALGIVQVSKSQTGEANAWDSMPKKTRNKFGSVIAHLHESAVNLFLVRAHRSRGQH